MAKGDNGQAQQPPPAQQPQQQQQGKPVTTTAIGKTIVIKGKLKSDEDLIVSGRIEAEIASSKALLVENSGIIKANVRVKSARISGVLVGNITAEERVEIAPDGRMVGDLTAPKIIINDGAAFRGRIDMQTFEEAQVAPTPQHQPQPHKEGREKGGKAPKDGGDHPTVHAVK
jgi:cytoskeletal protein CcmA (bactofilin family)